MPNSVFLDTCYWTFCSILSERIITILLLISIVRISINDGLFDFRISNTKFDILWQFHAFLQKTNCKIFIGLYGCPTIFWWFLPFLYLYSFIILLKSMNFREELKIRMLNSFKCWHQIMSHCYNQIFSNKESSSVFGGYRISLALFVLHIPFNNPQTIKRILVVVLVLSPCIDRGQDCVVNVVFLVWRIVKFIALFGQLHNT